MIAFSYINTTAATIAAVRDYLSMRFIIENTPDEIARSKAALTDMTAPLSLSPSPPPGGYKEDRLPDQLFRIDVLRDRLATAREYMAWFEPAWNFLSDKERTVLNEFYLQQSRNSGATQRVMAVLGVSEATAERLRGRALNHLRTLLYGKR
jgi:hypothetical protein